MFRVLKSKAYRKEFKKLNVLDQRRVSNFERKLKINPTSGRHLTYNFIREKKFNGKRLLFLVYEEYKVIFLLILTHKKAQQYEIGTIKEKLDTYRQIVRNLFEKT
jgi:mRNA-degrading endonuclease RelE of RelBE toxin-antitoxin system